jgi:hypothetical protein
MRDGLLLPADTLAGLDEVAAQAGVESVSRD